MTKWCLQLSELSAVVLIELTVVAYPHARLNLWANLSAELKGTSPEGLARELRSVKLFDRVAFELSLGDAQQESIGEIVFRTFSSLHNFWLLSRACNLLFCLLTLRIHKAEKLFPKSGIFFQAWVRKLRYCFGLHGSGLKSLKTFDFLSFGRIRIFKTSVLYSFVGVDKLAGQILFALDTLNIELLTHAIRVKGSFAGGAFECFLV